jgi:hypothetical protein
LICQIFQTSKLWWSPAAVVVDPGLAVVAVQAAWFNLKDPRSPVASFLSSSVKVELVP